MRWSGVYPWLLPALAMLLVARIGVARPALGYDENVTWSVGLRTPGQIIKLAGHMDGVIAPYYMFMHFWMAVFGDSVGVMRLPSLLAVVAGVGLVGELGRRLSGPGVGLTAGLIMAAVPQMSRYAQDARAYGFAFFFAVLSTLLLYLAVEKPTWWRWIAYGAALTLLGAAHMIGLLVLSGHVVTVAIRWWAGRDRRVPIRWAIMVFAAVVLVSPLIKFGLTERDTQLGWISPMNLHTVLEAPGAIFGAPAVGLLVIGLAFAARWQRRPLLVGELAALAAFPPILLITVSFVTSSLWVPRYVLFVIMPLALLGAVALRGLHWRSVAALILVAAMGFTTQQDLRGPMAHGGTDFRKVGSIVRARVQPGDAVVYSRLGTWALRDSLDYQLRGDSVRPRDVTLRRSAAEAGGLDAIECPDATCFTDERVWFFGFRPSPSDPLYGAGDKLKRKLATEYTRVGSWQLQNGMVALYQRKPPVKR
jgi:mannosyltransferase